MQIHRMQIHRVRPCQLQNRRQSGSANLAELSRFGASARISHVCIRLPGL